MEAYQDGVNPPTRAARNATNNDGDSLLVGDLPVADTRITRAAAQRNARARAEVNANQGGVGTNTRGRRMGASLLESIRNARGTRGHRTLMEAERLGIDMGPYQRLNTTKQGIITRLRAHINRLRGYTEIDPNE